MVSLSVASLLAAPHLHLAPNVALPRGRPGQQHLQSPHPPLTRKVPTLPPHQVRGVQCHPVEGPATSESESQRSSRSRS